MNLYEVRDTFSRTTGRKAGTERVFKAFCCDYCGRDLGEDLTGHEEFEDSVPVTYSLNQEADMEESWYYMDRPKTPEGKPVRPLQAIFGDENNKFIFCPACELLLMAEALVTVRAKRKRVVTVDAEKEIKAFLKANGLGKIMDDPRSFHYAMCEARLRVITKLLKTMQPDELGLEVDDA